MIYNTLSGSNISNNSSLFDRFNNEECFLSFGRSDNIWGECALVNISLYNDTNISDLFGTDLFNDKKEVSYSDVTRTVYIYKSTSPDFDTTVTNYSKIERSELNTGEPILLEYMNSNWCLLKNLPVNYTDLFSTDNGESYYIFPQQGFYSANPLSDTTNRNFIKINMKSYFFTNSLSEFVKLKLIIPTTNAIYDVFSDYLTKVTTILGESFVIGLTKDIIEDINSMTEATLLSFSNNTPVGSARDNNPYFYLVDGQNNLKSSRMYLQNTIDTHKIQHIYQTDDKQNTYLVFKNETIDNQSIDNKFEYYYSKISLEQTYNSLAIYNETLPFAYAEITSPTNITDVNPPSLDINYLKTNTISKSLFDTKSYMRILNDEFKFVRQIKSSIERDNFTKVGFTETNSSNKYFESIILESDIVFRRFSNLSRVHEAGTNIFYLFNNTFFIGELVHIDNASYTITESNYEFGYIVIYNDSLINTIPTIPKKLAEATEFSVADVYSTNETTTINKIEYAVCDQYDDALTYYMDSVMVTKNVPNVSTDIYGGIYRQLSICYRPSYVDTSGNIYNCGDQRDINNFIDTFGTNLYNTISKRYENGTVLYLSNKSPIYRKYIANGVPESFKIII